jgi:quercetin dioxygenase-like cupin family protein
MALTAGGRALRAPAGSFVQIPPGLAHGVTVTEPARWLDLRTPAR